MAQKKIKKDGNLKFTQKNLRMSQVAKTILEQLGGDKFIVMTGSKNFRFADCSLTMRLIPNRTHAKFLRIELNASDLYDLYFFTIDKHLNEIPKKEISGVYDEMLQSSFTNATGLHTKLF